MRERVLSESLHFGLQQKCVRLKNNPERFRGNFRCVNLFVAELVIAFEDEWALLLEKK